MKAWIGRPGRLMRRAIVGMAVFATAVGAYAEAVIESISGSIQGGAEVVRIELSEPIAAIPAGFVVQSPARIALDFPGVRSGLAQNQIPLGTGNAQSANIVQAKGRARVVLNLKQPVTYRAEVEGKSVFISLASGGGTSSPAPAEQVFSESRNESTLPLRDIDFRRGVENTGRLIVDLANNQVGVDIRQQGSNLLVEFLKTSLPEGLRRRLDVSDFGTPVQTISATQIGDRVKMLVEPKGRWEYSAYQSDTQLVIEIRQQKTNKDKLTQGQGYNGEKLSLNFQNIDVRSLLQVIADFTNFNVVTSDSVQGNLTLRLKDVPWDQALDIILQAKNLGVKRAGNVLHIAPKEEMAAKDKAELQARVDIEGLEPLVTESFQLNYTKAIDIARQMLGTIVDSNGNPVNLGSTNTSGSGNNTVMRILSQRGTVIAEPRTNQLFVSDIASRLEQVREMIAKLDVPIRQVLIEARIVEANDTFGKSLGVKLGGADLRGVNGGDAGYSVGNNNRVAFGGNYDAVGATTGAFPGGLTSASSQFVNLPAQAMTNVNATPSSFAISLFNSAANRFLNLEISALEADNKGRVVSSPRVATGNQIKAVIEQGVEFPYQQATSSGATSIAFRKAVLRLEVTPQITPEGNIILDLNVNKDTPGIQVEGGMAINTKNVQTQVLVENGGTVVIGGIFELTETDSTNKVPLLGDIPILGNLFKQRMNSIDKTETLVFITPKIISDQGSVR